MIGYNEVMEKQKPPPPQKSFLPLPRKTASPSPRRRQNVYLLCSSRKRTVPPPSVSSPMKNLIMFPEAAPA